MNDVFVWVVGILWVISVCGCYNGIKILYERINKYPNFRHQLRDCKDKLLTLCYDDTRLDRIAQVCCVLESYISCGISHRHYKVFKSFADGVIQYCTIVNDIQENDVPVLKVADGILDELIKYADEVYTLCREKMEYQYLMDINRQIEKLQRRPVVK